MQKTKRVFGFFMKQALKSQKSIQLVLDAGLDRFSKQGYRATSMKQIAQQAGISTGRVYHHFDNKLAIFTQLLDQYWEYLADPELTLNRLSQAAQFPDDFTDLANAIREVVAEKKAYINLIYVDVIEFHGEHIQRFYRGMADRFKKTYGPRFQALRDAGRLKPDADPLFAVMMTFRFFFHYFLVETSFGVEDHFGFGTQEVIRKAQQTILHGLLAEGTRNDG